MIRRIYKKKIIMLFTGVIVCFIIIALAIRKHSQMIQMSSFDRLKSLPYMAWTSARGTIKKRGVIKYDRTKSFPGINIYSDTFSSKSYLIDMAGNVLHTWSREGPLFQAVKMCKNGDLIAIIPYKSLIVLDWNSNVKWIKKMWFHHDVAVAENNDIYAIASKNGWFLKFLFPFPVEDNYIIVLSSKGKIKREISLCNTFKKEIPLRNLIRIFDWWLVDFDNMKQTIAQQTSNIYSEKSTPLDILHTNTVEIIDKDIAGFCKKGDLLISMTNIDLIAILDIQTRKVIWKSGKGVFRPHHAVLLENGNILFFNNAMRINEPQIVELNPLTNKIVWRYKLKHADELLAYSRGSAQRLPNGNTLITENVAGHAFEVTPGGEIVWEFYNPNIKENYKERATISRMVRMADFEDYPCLKNTHIR
jgi:hypothetical protein